VVATISGERDFVNSELAALFAAFERPEDADSGIASAWPCLLPQGQAAAWGNVFFQEDSRRADGVREIR
jgi:hypothetical protein